MRLTLIGLWRKGIRFALQKDGGAGGSSVLIVDATWSFSDKFGYPH